MKINKMKTVVSMNWRIKDLIRDKLSFEKWHQTVFGVPASQKVLNKIKTKGRELKQMRAAELSLAMDEATA
jgi:hypothetical protein